MKKILLLFPVLFILFGCKKSDEKLNSLIFGTWRAYQPPAIAPFLNNRSQKFIFYYPNHCLSYDDSYDSSTWNYYADTLTFEIMDEKLYLYRKNVLANIYPIVKLSHNTLKLKSATDDNWKFRKE